MEATSSTAAACRVRDLAEAVRGQIGRVVVGRGNAVERLLVALLAGGHALIEDLPGTGKTTLARTLAAALELSFARIQFTPDLMPSDVVGVNAFDTARGSFSFHPGPVFTNVLLADEINRATPRAQSALLEAMQEEQVSVDGETRSLPSPFLVIATQNPIEMEGTFALPEAQLDRFLVRLSLGLPSRDEESELLERYRVRARPPTVEAVAGPREIEDARSAVRAVTVAAPVRGYVLDIVAATRGDDRLRVGASPRAALALQVASQAKAALAGRGFVLPDDVKAMAASVLGHRLVVDAQALLRGHDGTGIVADLLARVPVPIGV